MVRFSVCVIVVMVMVGCSGEGAGSPTSPTPPTSTLTPASSPTVTFDVTYYTNHLTTDPDHFRLAIAPLGASGSGGGAFPTNPGARTPGSITWTGKLAPGRYTAMVELYSVDRLIDITFFSAAGSAPGGVERNSMRYKDSNSAPVNVYAYRPCGVTTTFTKRPDLAGLSGLTYVAFEFVVSTGSASPTC
jgi:hypothetical protein